MVLCSFRKKFSLRTLLFLGLAAALLVSCSDSSGGSNDSYSPNSFGTDLRFNVSGAKALAAGSDSSVNGSMRSVDGLADLVRINDDGTIESAIFSESEYASIPVVSFISVGDDRSVYICFQSMYYSYNESTGESIQFQFVRIYPDNHFDILWPLDPTDENQNSYVSTWTWDGMDSDPLQKGDDDQLYFKVESWTSSGSDNYVYSYNPAIGGKPVLRTPANARLSIDSFKTDSKQHLYIKGSSNSSYFLRCYTPNVTAPVNIYYSSDSSPWVRGYTPNAAGDALIINGYDINGMSGIIHVKLQATGYPTYEQLYFSDMNYVQLAQGYNFSWPTAIITQESSEVPDSWAWDSSVLTEGSLDKEKLLSRIASLYKTPPSITDENFNLIKSVSDLRDYTQTAVTKIENDDGSVQDVSGWTLGNIINSYPAGFLRQYFEGQLVTDWIRSKGLTYFDVQNIAELIWGGDGSLYGIYNSMCYGAGNSAYVVKLLDSAGNKTLDIVPLANGECKPTRIKIVGDYLYYRYSIMNGTMELGYHGLARFNIITSQEEEILSRCSGLSGRSVELLSYDVSSDNSVMYISAYDYATNAVIFGEINLASMQFTEIPSETAYDTVRTF